MMYSRIRDVRKAKGLTLEQVAAACGPPTTAQTIGRLETGMRSLSLGWLNRIAIALGVEASTLVGEQETADVAIAALMGPDGTQAPSRPALSLVPSPTTRTIGVRVVGGVGDYRAGDDIWCRSIGPEDYASALNRDVLVPRPTGRFVFGRLIGRDDGRLLILPLGAGARQQVVTDPPWLAIAERLLRTL